MTDEGTRQANEIMLVLDEALRKIEAFYDCRIVLGSLMGVTSGFAASLFRAKALTPQQVADYFAAGLNGAFEERGKVPQVHYEGQNSGEVKQ